MLLTVAVSGGRIVAVFVGSERKKPEQGLGLELHCRRGVWSSRLRCDRLTMGCDRKKPEQGLPG